jgi:predicted metal-dependent hydrolase
MMNISDKSQQTYQKYYLQDWKIYSYEINYDNWVVNWNIMLDDVDKRNVLIKKLQKLWLELSNSDSNIMFSWELDNINSLLSILD